MYLDVALHVTLDGVEGDAAEDVEEGDQGLGGFEELSGVDRIVLGSVDVHVGEALAAVEVSAARRKRGVGGHGCNVCGVRRWKRTGAVDELDAEGASVVVSARGCVRERCHGVSMAPRPGRISSRPCVAADAAAVWGRDAPTRADCWGLEPGDASARVHVDASASRCRDA